MVLVIVWVVGYLFYQTRDGFNFKSIDKIFEQSPVKNYLYNNINDSPSGGYDGKILSYSIDRDVDTKESMSLGTYNNRSIFFDFYSMNYKVVNFDIGEQKSKLSTGKKFAPDQVCKRIHPVTYKIVQSCSRCWDYS